MFHFSSEFSLIFNSRPLWAYTCINDNYFWICLWDFFVCIHWLHEIGFRVLKKVLWSIHLHNNSLPHLVNLLPNTYLCSRFLRLTTNFPSLLKYAHLSQNFITSPCSQLSPNTVVKKKKKNSHALYFIWKCYAKFGYLPKEWEKRWLEEIIGKQPLPSHL